MLLKVVAVKDNAVQAYIQPVPAAHVGVCVREFTQACNNPEHSYYKNPGDFDLYEIGTWDNETGRFENLDVAVCLIRGVVAKETQH